MWSFQGTGFPNLTLSWAQMIGTYCLPGFAKNKKQNKTADDSLKQLEKAIKA